MQNPAVTALPHFQLDQQAPLSCSSEACVPGTPIGVHLKVLSIELLLKENAETSTTLSMFYKRWLIRDGR